MPGLDDDLSELTGPQSFQFPSATRGLSSYGARQLDMYSKLIPEETGLNAALSELQLEKSRFAFLSEKRKIEAALREERDKNRTAEQGILGLQSSQTLNPESDDYFLQKSELMKGIPYANYDPAFTRAMQVLDSRHANYSQIKQGEEKIRHRETYAAYKSMLDSLSGPELFEYGDQVIGLSPDSPMKAIEGALSTIKQTRATRELDRDLRLFGYEPKDFDNDLTAKAKEVAKQKSEYDFNKKQQKDLQELYKVYSKAVETIPIDAEEKAAVEQAKKQLTNTVLGLASVSDKLSKFESKKDRYGNVKDQQKKPTVESTNTELDTLKKIQQASVGSTFTLPDGREFRVTRRAQDDTNKRLQNMLDTNRQ